MRRTRDRHRASHDATCSRRTPRRHLPRHDTQRRPDSDLPRRRRQHAPCDAAHPSASESRIGVPGLLLHANPLPPTARCARKRAPGGDAPAERVLRTRLQPSSRSKRTPLWRAVLLPTRQIGRTHARAAAVHRMQSGRGRPVRKPVRLVLEQLPRLHRARRRVPIRRLDAATCVLRRRPHARDRAHP